ncbi:MAG TPA: hypothetical protein VF316_04990 [Polyangiaceae bacterium]
MRASLVAGCVLVMGCSYGLGETPRTLPKGHVSGNTGISMVFNGSDAQRGGVGTHNLAPQLGPVRFGVAPHVDVGVATLFGLGLRADVKVSPTRPTLPFAFAVRAGGGAAVDTSNRSLAMAFAGVLASYTFGGVEPYVGATFANHWIYGQPAPDPASLAPGERYATRQGYGDGIVELTVGLRVSVSTWGSVSFEYSRWQPAQDDPGDFYRFVANDIASLGLCVGCWTRADALAAAGVGTR